MRGQTRITYAIVFIFSLCLTLISCSTYISSIESDGARVETARRALAERIIVNMDQCARIGKRMGYSGANIQHALYPEVKPVLFAIKECNTAARNAFGAEYAPISDSHIKKIFDTCQALELAYASGKPAYEYEAALREYLVIFGDLLDYRFTEDGDIACFFE